jgi:N-acetylmuramoyl-L-alanine amidase
MNGKSWLVLLGSLLFVVAGLLWAHHISTPAAVVQPPIDPEPGGEGDTAPEPEPAPPVPVVLIDAGHGGGDGGAVNGKIAEKDITLAIALLLRDALADSGLNVVLTRDSDVHVTTAERVDKANLAQADLIVSIHVNAFTQSRVRGVETYYRDGCPESRMAAQVLHAAVLKAHQQVGHETSDRGLRTGTFRILRLTEAKSAVLLELGYISNRGDRETMINSSFQAALSERLAEAVIVLLSEEPKAP